jgi:hypothetical protein
LETTIDHSSPRGDPQMSLDVCGSMFHLVSSVNVDGACASLDNRTTQIVYECHRTTQRVYECRRATLMVHDTVAHLHGGMSLLGSACCDILASIFFPAESCLAPCQDVCMYHVILVFLVGPSGTVWSKLRVGYVRASRSHPAEQ